MLGLVRSLGIDGSPQGHSHDFASLTTTKSVQQLLSTEIHQAILEELKERFTVRTRNLMLACTMPHASDWLLAPPIPALGLGLQSDVFRTLKYRLGLPLCSEPVPCPALSSKGVACGDEMDVFGDHSICCHHNVRDILGHSARAAGLAAVVLEKKNQVSGSGDITVQQYHRGFATSAHQYIAMEEAGSS